MFLRDCWYVAAWSHEVGDATPVGITITDKPIVLYRRIDGTIVALEDRCVHRLAPLSLGRCEGNNLRCMYHGLLFGPKGNCVEIPGQELVPEKARVTSYPATERYGWIWVWMGKPEKADESLLPRSIALDDPNWHFESGQLDYAANFQLISDNLTDFSHLSFVHSQSFGSGLNWALSQPSITQLDRGIRVERWVEKDPKPGFLACETDFVDQYILYEYLAPGILLMTTEAHLHGTAAEYPLGGERPEALFATYSPQAVTPIDEQRSRYFFAWGPRAVDGSKAAAGEMMKVALKAFGEDKTMIEAQQEIIKRDPARREMPILADKGVTLFQRTMDRLRRQEAA